MIHKTLRRLVFSGLVLGLAVLLTPAQAHAQKGGGGGSGDTIKVSKCEYFNTGGGYVELLIKASSSDPSAHLFAYLPSGQLLGEVQNGGGGRYGGTVFTAPTAPATITIKSSSGGSITADCVLGQL